MDDWNERHTHTHKVLKVTSLAMLNKEKTQNKGNGKNEKENLFL